MKTSRAQFLFDRLFRIVIGASLVAGLLTFVSPATFSALADTASGNALLFDGAEDYVDITNGVVLGTTFTQEAWIFPTYSDSNYHGILGYDPGYDYQRPPSLYGFGLKIYYGFGYGTTWCNDTTGNVLTRNAWNHVAATFDGAIYLVYVNGVQIDSSTTCSGHTPVSNPQRYIGRMDTYFQGYIDEVRIWTVVRTPAEIRANMYRELNPTSNLAAYYKLNESGSTAATADSSGNGRDGTLTYFSFDPSPWRTSGAFAGPRNAIDVEGANEYIDISNGAELGASFTEEAWIYPNSSSTVYRGFLGYDPGPDYERSPSLYVHANKIHYGFGDGTYWLADETGDVLVRHEWNHVAATFDGTTYRIYVNGILVDSSLVASGATPYATPVRRIGEGDYNFKGRIDEVRIWTTVRTAEEIRDGMTRTLAGNESGLAAYYRFDQYNASDQTVLYDLTSNARNGTLVNINASNDWASSAAFNTWIGSTDTDWGAGVNWSRGSKPGACDNVGVYSYSGGNAPVLSTNSVFRNLEIGSGATLTASGSPSLIVQNNWLAHGTFTHGSSTVTMASDETQYIGGGSTAVFNHLKAGSSHYQVAHWKLDEDSETSAFDAADDDNTGELIGGPVWSDDVAADMNYCNSGSLQFDGSDDHVSIPDSTDFDFGIGPFTISMWYKKTGENRGELFNWNTNDDSDELSIFSQVDEYVQFYLRINNGTPVTITSSASIPLNEWHHIALVRDESGNITMYLDSVSDGTTSSTADLNNIDSTPIFLGSNRDGSGSPTFLFSGYLDDVRMYSTNLSLEEVQNLAGKFDCSDNQVILDTPIQVNGNLTISDLDVSSGSHAVGVAGNWTRVSRGSFYQRSGTVTFNGTSAQSLNGATTFYNLTANNTAGISFNNNMIVSNMLTLTSDLSTGAYRLDMGSGATSSGSGDVVGAVRRTDLGATARAFGNPYVTIAITAGTAPNPMDVTLSKGSEPFSGAVKRRYTLTPTGGSGYTATVRLHYLVNEVNGNNEANLQLWRFDTGQSKWLQQTRTTAVDTTNKWVEKNDVTAFSYWAISEKGSPTAVVLTRFEPLATNAGVRLEWETANETGLLGYNLYRSQTIDGGYNLLNDEPVWAKGLGGSMGATYSMEDANLQPGETYFYKLEAIGSNGTQDFETVSFAAPYQIYLAVVVRD